jgi:hypothetical protein
MAVDILGGHMAVTRAASLSLQEAIGLRGHKFIHRQMDVNAIVRQAAA